VTHLAAKSDRCGIAEVRAIILSLKSAEPCARYFVSGSKKPSDRSRGHLLSKILAGDWSDLLYGVRRREAKFSEILIGLRT
jgi:hypothetical protein